MANTNGSVTWIDVLGGFSRLLLKRQDDCSAVELSRFLSASEKDSCIVDVLLECIRNPKLFGLLGGRLRERELCVRVKEILLGGFFSPADVESVTGLDYPPNVLAELLGTLPERSVSMQLQRNGLTLLPKPPRPFAILERVKIRDDVRGSVRALVPEVYDPVRNGSLWLSIRGATVEDSVGKDSVTQLRVLLSTQDKWRMNLRVPDLGELVWAWHVSVRMNMPMFETGWFRVRSSFVKPNLVVPGDLNLRIGFAGSDLPEVCVCGPEGRSSLGLAMMVSG